MYLLAKFSCNAIFPLNQQYIQNTSVLLIYNNKSKFLLLKKMYDSTRYCIYSFVMKLKIQSNVLSHKLEKNIKKLSLVHYIYI